MRGIVSITARAHRSLLCKNVLAPRRFSATPNPLIEDESDTRPFSVRVKESMNEKLKEAKSKGPSYSVVGGTVFGSAFMLYQSLRFIDFLDQAEVPDAVYASFSTGVAFSLATATAIGVSKRMLALQPEQVRDAVGTRISSDPKILEFFGSSPQLGNVLSVTVLPGAFRIRKEKGEDFGGWERWWKPRTAKILFEVQGEKGKALVLAELQKFVRGFDRYQTLQVFPLDSTAEPLNLMPAPKSDAK